METKAMTKRNEEVNFDDFKAEVLNDYKTAVLSREMSLAGRKEVLTGKAKFGIFGDGKELAQIALSKAFEKGDWRSGYYRDQTWMLALGELTVEQFFSQLYANPDQELDPFSAGRQMNAHFATRLQDKNGQWLNHTELITLRPMHRQRLVRCRAHWVWPWHRRCIATIHRSKTWTASRMPATRCRLCRLVTPLPAKGISGKP
jgi:hypothetical protein